MKTLKERTKLDIMSLLKSRRLSNSEIDILTQMLEDMSTERTHYNDRKYEYIKRRYLISGICLQKNLTLTSSVIMDSSEDVPQ